MASSSPFCQIVFVCVLGEGAEGGGERERERVKTRDFFSKFIESIIPPIPRQPTFHHHHHLSSHNIRISKHPATGPTMSLQLTLPPPIETRQVSRISTDGAAEVQLSQERSLCLVKIFLNASLGCICFARGLIPCDSPSYRDRRVDDLVLISLASTPASYHKFLSFQGQLS